MKSLRLRGGGGQFPAIQEFIAAGPAMGTRPIGFGGTLSGRDPAAGGMFEPNQRVTVDLSGLVIQGVTFSQNVQKVLGKIVQQVSTTPSTYTVELLVSFKGIKRVDVPEAHIHPT